MMPSRWVAVAMAYVPLRVDVDPRTGRCRPGSVISGASASDQAALEIALRCGERWAMPVVAVCAGPQAAEALLREALACGASDALLLETPPDPDPAPPPGLPWHLDAVAALLADALRGSEVVLCGDRTPDGGTGAVPALLAHHLGAEQALGCTELEVDGDELLARRRLDGAARESLRLRAPAVVSVEPGAARLRRAGLAEALAATRRQVQQQRVGRWPQEPSTAVRTAPFRPPPPPLAAPSGSANERIVALTGSAAPTRARQVLHVAPDEGARLVLQALREHRR